MKNILRHGGNVSSVPVSAVLAALDSAERKEPGNIMNNIDHIYRDLIEHIINNGNEVIVRGNKCHQIFPYSFVLRSEDSPLLLTRKVAWKTAIREYDWFVSGKIKLPDDPILQKWWDGQMNVDGEYPYGYGQNMRSLSNIDQLANLIRGIKEDPAGRRHIITLWNPMQAEYIRYNDYSRMPTTCHGTIIQASVTDNVLNLFHYQRSADVMLGLPHNIVQYKALLLYLCRHTGNNPGDIYYTLGDAHIYHEHLQKAHEIIHTPITVEAPKLQYKSTGGIDRHNVPIFRMTDFSLDSEYIPLDSSTLPLII